MSTNVEDRRGASGLGSSRMGGFRLPAGLPTGGGGLGLGGAAIVIVVLLGLWLFGGDLTSTSTDGTGSAVATDINATPSDDLAQFAATILASTEDVWSAIFARAGATYAEPTLVLFTGSTQSACGFASAAVGPFYCPSDQKLYIDLGFYDELARRFGAPGDFAQAYVLAHEVGHHVQNLTGVLSREQRAAGGAEANLASVRIELQADCYAGVWGYFAGLDELLEPGDLEEALNAAAQIGDDAIQRREQGYVVPESFNHGTSVQRATWFRRGFESGNLNACDTFSAVL
jgi:predicted metalloprotease